MIAWAHEHSRILTLAAAQSSFDGTEQSEMNHRLNGLQLQMSLLVPEISLLHSSLLKIKFFFPRQINLSFIRYKYIYQHVPHYN